MSAATFEIDLEKHVYPVLHLARMAVVLEKMLSEIDTTLDMLPELRERFKSLDLITDYGTSLADYVDVAILGATDLLEAHQRGPIFVVAQEGGAA